MLVAEKPGLRLQEFWPKVCYEMKVRGRMLDELVD